MNPLNPTRHMHMSIENNDGNTYHNHLYGNGNGQLGFISFVYLLHNEHHNHDDNGHYQVAQVGGSDLTKNLYQGLWEQNK